jgi:hypothetical protein
VLNAFYGFASGCHRAQPNGTAEIARLCKPKQNRNANIFLPQSFLLLSLHNSRISSARPLS